MDILSITSKRQVVCVLLVELPSLGQVLCDILKTLLSLYASLKTLLANLMFGIDLNGARFFFNAVREGDSIAFACDDENEINLWVMAMYRATGQSHKPTPPVTSDKNSAISKIQGGQQKIFCFNLISLFSIAQLRLQSLATLSYLIFSHNTRLHF